MNNDKLNKTITEYDLYEPMRKWLHDYLTDKYKGYEIITTYESHKERLEKTLEKYGIICNASIGIDIQIDVVGIAKKGNNVKLFFIEAKKTSLTLKDLGQLWAYCKLIDPEEAFLLTSKDLGSLNKIFNILSREDLLDFGDGKRIKKMKIAIWNINRGMPEYSTMIPKL